MEMYHVKLFVVIAIAATVYGLQEGQQLDQEEGTVRSRRQVCCCNGKYSCNCNCRQPVQCCCRQQTCICPTPNACCCVIPTPDPNNCTKIGTDLGRNLTYVPNHGFYLFVETPEISWTAANDYCNALNLHLAVIESAAEQTALQNIIGPRTAWWIGLRTVMDPAIPSSLAWVTGKQFSFTEGYSGFAPGSIPIHPRCIYVANGRWGATRCDQNAWGSFACEVPDACKATCCTSLPRT